MESANLTAETIQSTSLSLEGIYNIERGNRLSFRVFRVCDSIADDTFEESLQDATCLFVDHGGDTLDTATTRQTSNGRLSYALDVVTKNLSVTLSSAFSEALSTFAASSHDDSSRTMRQALKAVFRNGDGRVEDGSLLVWKGGCRVGLMWREVESVQYEKLFEGALESASHINKLNLI